MLKGKRNVVTSNELAVIYRQRFGLHLTYRNTVWQVLVSNFFSRFVGDDAVTLDLGCGYGEFINHVNCRTKYAMDLNGQVRGRLKPDVAFLQQDCSSIWPCDDDSLDVVFTSNFFEHLDSKQALSNTLAQALRCLRPGGRIIALGPNIRFVGGAYWDFWDHHIALTEASLAEAMQLQGFEIERVIDRFLPYTMVKSQQIPAVLVSLYLKLPFTWTLFGKQFLVLATKPRRGNPEG